jgi:hypothetical protein
VPGVGAGLESLEQVGLSDSNLRQRKSNIQVLLIQPFVSRYRGDYVMRLLSIVSVAIQLLIPVAAAAQSTIAYYLHGEGSPVTAGLFNMRTAGPDAPASIRSIGIGNCAGAVYPCEQSMGVWETSAGVPGQTGLILQGSTVTFRVWARKTKNFATVYARARIVLTSETNVGASVGATPTVPICTATGTTALSTTWTAYTFSCTSEFSIAVTPDSRFIVVLAQWITAGPGNKVVAFETGIEGALNGNYDSRVSVPNPLSGMSLVPNCPLAVPNDFLSDDQAIQDCLNAGGIVALAPGLYEIHEGLVLTHNGTTLIGVPWAGSAAVLLADPNLDAPMLRVDNAVSRYTISFLEFNGNKPNRQFLIQCGLGDYDQ